MGIQPIDLQTMYSQLSNVSKNLQASQQAQLTEAMQQQNNIQKSLENNSKVHQTTTDKDTASGVNQNASNSSSFQNQNKKNSKEDKNDDSEKSTYSQSKPSYLGTIIDITR